MRGQRSELPERHSAPECSAAYPHLRLWAASPETESESAGLRRAESAMPEAIASHPRAVRPAAQLESAARQQAE